VPDLIAAAAARAAAAPSDFGAQELATLFWAAAAAAGGEGGEGGVGNGCPTPPAVWAALAPAGAASLAASPASWSPQAVSMAAWALGRARWRDEVLFAAAAAHAASRLGEWGPQALANLAWAAATVGAPWPAGLVEAALLKAAACAGNERCRSAASTAPAAAAAATTPQALANLMWAGATLGALRPSLLASVAASPGGRATLLGPGCDGRALDQVWQADRLCAWAAGEAAGSGGGGGDGPPPSLPSCLPPDLAAAAAAARAAAVAATPFHASGLHNAVLAAARRAVGEGGEGAGDAAPPSSSTTPTPPPVRLTVTPEALVGGSTLRVDVAVVAEGASLGAPPLRIALEADGPAHFLASHAPGPGTRTGGTANRDALLSAAGWAAVPVPYAAWDALGGDPAAEAAYVRSLLDGAVVEWKARQKKGEC